MQPSQLSHQELSDRMNSDHRIPRRAEVMEAIVRSDEPDLSLKLAEMHENAPLNRKMARDLMRAMPHGVRRRLRFGWVRNRPMLWAHS